MNAKQFAIFKKADKYHSQQMSDTSPNFFPKGFGYILLYDKYFLYKKKKKSKIIYYFLWHGWLIFFIESLEKLFSVSF